VAVDVGTLRIRILSDLSEFMRGMQDVQGRLRNLGSSLQETGRTLSLGITAPLTALGGFAIKSAIDFESAFAGVRKTVDATEEEFAQLRQGIRDMAKEVPASREEIAAVAEAAGQLGISTENIMSFTRTMIDLGVSTNLSSDQAATALARLANITQMPQDQFDRLGSTIVALGNNLATTEAEIVEMGLRIAGAGHQIGLTEPQILGFAAALSSVGIEAEAGGSAISRVMIEIANAVSDGGEDLARFAAVAGMTVDEFRTAFETDAVGAIIAFIEGLNRMSASGENVFEVLDELGLSEIRVRDALLRMAGAGDLVRESVELGNKAWEENTALTNEARQRYETTASQLRILWNRLTDVALTIGEVLLPKVNELIDRAQPLMDRLGALAQKFTQLDPKLQNFILIVAGIVAAIGPLLVMLGVVASALAALSLPIILVVAGVALLAAGIAALIIWWDDLSARFSILGELLNWLRGQWEHFNSWIHSDAIPVFENVQAAFAKVQEAVGYLRAEWAEFWAFISPTLFRLTDWIGTQIPGAVDFLRSQWESFWGAAGPHVTEAVRVALDFLGRFAGFIRDEVLPRLGEFIDALADPIRTGRDLANTLSGPLTTALTTVKDVTADVVGFFDRWKGVIVPVAATITGLLIPAMIKMAVTAVTSAAQAVGAWLAMKAQAIATATVHAVTVLPQIIASWISMGAQAAINAAKVVASWALTGASAVTAAVTHVVQIGIMVAQWALLGIQSLIHAAKVAAAWFIALGPISWVTAAVIGLVALIIMNWDTIARVTTELWEGIKNVTTHVWNGIKSFLSGNWQEILTIALLILTGPGGLVFAFTSNAFGIRDKVVAAFTTMRDWAVGAVRGLLDGAISLLSGLLDWVRGLPGSILEALGDLGSLLWQAGRDLIQGLIDGIKSMAGAAKEAAKGVVSGVKNAVTGFLGIRSPSTVFMEIGRDLTAGLSLGLERGAAEVARAAEGLAGMTVAPMVSLGSAGHSPAPLVGTVTINVSAISRDDADAVARAVDERIRRVLSDVARSQPLIGRQAGRA